MSTPTTTRIDEIAPRIHRISVAFPPALIPGGFTFNQFLLAGDEPLLYHTGLRQIFHDVCGAIERVLPVARLRYVGFSHYEADECGALNDFLALAPRAEPLCGAVAKMVSVDDVALRPARALANGEELDLGGLRVRWIDAPHVPHNWECGHLFETTTRTLLCGDLFTQGGHEHPPVTESDVLAPSLAELQNFDYFACTPGLGAKLEELALLEPRRLGCMHGASYRGDGAALLRGLARSLTGRRAGAG